MKKLKVYAIIVCCFAIVFVTGSVCLDVFQPEKHEVVRQKLAIWGSEAPGNSTKSKLEDMNILSAMPKQFVQKQFGTAIVGSEFDRSAEAILDTYTYQNCICTGQEKPTYEDQPSLTPYLVPNSDSAVIVVPGGAYCYKVTNPLEGESVALELNKCGINAFVLWYRSNPYQYPIPQLDLQRAVRYLRFNAENFGIDPNKISMIGFSAGGNLVASYINLIQGKNLLPENYVQDEIDDIDDQISSAAMIYPLLTYHNNVNMLFASFDSSTVGNAVLREELLAKTDLIENFDSASVTQFVAFGTTDEIVLAEDVENYVAKAKINAANITSLKVEGQGHAFGTQYYFDLYKAWLKNIFAK